MHNTNEPSLLEEMRASRDTSNVAFITFTDNYKNHLTHTFCFYEGEDGKYYNQRIKQLLGENIVPLRVGGKKNVLKLCSKITNDNAYIEISKMFFVDRDMDTPPEDINNDLYITPCYSIENLYVLSSVLKRILESEFYINIAHPDYKKCEKHFELLYEKFCEEMIEFNALVLIRKNKKLGNGKVRLSDIKTNQLISITLSEINKIDKYITLIEDLKSKLNVDEDKVTEAISKIRANGDFGNSFRGKNQLDFLLKFIELLKAANKTAFFTTEHPKPSIHVGNNSLSSLSQYAETPSCLINFILNHKIN